MWNHSLFCCWKFGKTYQKSFFLIALAQVVPAQWGSISVLCGRFWEVSGMHSLHWVSSGFASSTSPSSVVQSSTTMMKGDPTCRTIANLCYNYETGIVPLEGENTEKSVYRYYSLPFMIFPVRQQPTFCDRVMTRNSLGWTVEGCDDIFSLSPQNFLCVLLGFCDNNWTQTVVLAVWHWHPFGLLTSSPPVRQCKRTKPVQEWEVLCAEEPWRPWLPPRSGASWTRGLPPSPGVRRTDPVDNNLKPKLKVRILDC